MKYCLPRYNIFPLDFPCKSPSEQIDTQELFKVTVVLQMHTSGLWPLLLQVWPYRPVSPCTRLSSLLWFFSASPRLDGSMETTNEILDSASHDCPLVTQTYSTAVAKGTHVPASPTRLGKGCDTNLEGK